MRQNTRTMMLGMALLGALFVFFKADPESGKKSLLAVSIDGVSQWLYHWHAGSDTTKPEGGAEAPSSPVVRLQVSDAGWSLKTITVREGDQVRIQVVNDGSRPHNLIIPEFRIVSRSLFHGERNYIEFTAGHAGTFSFFSDAPGHVEPGLTGQLHVLPRRTAAATHASGSSVRIGNYSAGTSNFIPGSMRAPFK
jgi:hypothetical protein